jgi:predicted NACHT family NTPase
LDPQAEASHFELEFRRSVIRNLDVLQLFGVDVPTTSRRHRLSVAYVTLFVKEISPFSFISPKRKAPGAFTTTSLQSRQELSSNPVSVDNALAASPRILIRGLAGSGKTTLLKWIAVNSASKSFKGVLTKWNKLIPFYISLRHCAQSGLPAPENFPSFTTSAISDTMPRGWVHKKLSEGVAIVLIDGLDEVPAFQRNEVQSWLKNLVETFPKSRYIITSRPHAVVTGWMDREGFDEADLQPMDLNDINAFIDHWHAAIAEELPDQQEKAELRFYAKHLKEEVERSRPKRNS